MKLHLGVKRDATCHVGSHSVTCHPTQVNSEHTPPEPQPQAVTRFNYPGGMESVDLRDWLHTEMVYPPTDGYTSTNPAVHGRERNSRPVSC